LSRVGVVGACELAIGVYVAVELLFIYSATAAETASLIGCLLQHTRASNDLLYLSTYITAYKSV